MTTNTDNASGAGMENFKSALGFLPCPFCGSPARFSFGNDGDVVSVRCVKWGAGCMGAGPREYSRDKAREGWNRRTAPIATVGVQPPIDNAFVAPGCEPFMWTLMAPDGRVWRAESALKCAAAEQRERIPPEVALQRIFAAANESDDASRLLAEKEGELQRMRADAERYRAIRRWDGAPRDGDSAPQIRLYGLQGAAEDAFLAYKLDSGDSLDAAIDAAIRNESTRAALKP